MGEKLIGRIQRILNQLNYDIVHDVGWHEHKMSREDIRWLTKIVLNAYNCGIINDEIVGELLNKE